MKKLSATILLSAMLVASAAGCGSTTAQPTASESVGSAPSVVAVQEATEQVDTANQTPYTVKINGAYRTTDNAGNDAIVVQCTWTNGGDYASNADSCLFYMAFQDGVQMDYAFTDDDASRKEVQPGTTQDITYAYILNGDSDVEFKLGALMDNGMMQEDLDTATFVLAELEVK